MLRNVDYEFEVKKKLRLKNMTISDLAKKLGISTAYCSDIIRGNRKAKEKRKEIELILKQKN